MKNQLKNKLLSKTEYLAAATGDAQKAFELMAADAYALQTEAQDFEAEGSIRAREIVRALTPLAEALNIPLPAAGAKPSAESVNSMSEAVSKAINAPKAETKDEGNWREVAQLVGLDVAAIEAAKTPEARSELIGSFKANITALQTKAADANLYRYAAKEGLNADALKRIRGSETLQEREVDAEDGTKTTVWGVVDGEKFTPASEAFGPLLTALKPVQEKRTAVAWIPQSGQSVTASKNPLIAAEKTADDKKTYSL